ncbi:MAG: hypothetical protein Q7K44_04730 [Candidatus Liptonbacteria bacterium]|nr:hypothetical protein [Candidatus Liptonbacteria bacterium]
MKHDFFIKSRILPLFDEGKLLEIKTATARFKSVKVGDEIVFNWSVTRTVKAIRRYPSFVAMGSREKPEHILPGATMGQIIEVLREIYSPEQEKKGVLVFELPP